MKCVRVVWHDAHDCSETWMLKEDIDKDPYMVTSVGFLLESAKPAHIVIAQSNSVDGHIDNIIAIPIGMVQAIEELS